MINSLYRTMLFVPGNDPDKIVKAEIYNADCIIFDLEDAVSVFEKDTARILVKNALKYNRPDCRVGVRINSADTIYYEDDIKTIAPLAPDFIRLPKVETTQDILNLDNTLTIIEKENKIEPGSIKIVATIETALGVHNSYEIAAASPRMLAIGLGAEDFRTDMHMERTENGVEILFARNVISLSAHAAGIMPIDYVYSNIKNEEGFKADVQLGKALGFTGKSIIHPKQVNIVHELFTPSKEAISHAKAVLIAYEEALKNTSGVIALNGKMIDKPIVNRAIGILAYARTAGIEV